VLCADFLVGPSPFYALQFFKMALVFRIYNKRQVVPLEPNIRYTMNAGSTGTLGQFWSARITIIALIGDSWDRLGK